MKFNPILVFSGYEGFKGGLEYQINPKFGLEAEGVFLENGNYYLLHGKYYFKPDQGTDIIYVGVFTGAGGQKNENAGLLIGAEAGCKIFHKRNFFGEFGLGVHSAFRKIEIPIYYKLVVGYRFSRKKKN
ncbi:MAG: hypothetical protein AB8H03_20700 [Saprospiraceae bacterium]